MSTELKALCWQYIKIVDDIGNGKVDAIQGEQKRRELHNQILDVAGLSMFEFGGLPFWFMIESVDQAANRLYNALHEQQKAKAARSGAGQAGEATD